MNEEEAIEQLKIIKNNIDKKYINTKNSNAIETVLNLLEEKDKIINSIKEYAQQEIDLTTVYMDGIYDERDKWKIKVKKKIEEIIQNSSHFNMISPLNYDKKYYETRFAVDKLQELLEERN